MNSRVKFIIIAILLALSLLGTIYAANATVRAVGSFQQQVKMNRAGDVRTISPWMTIPYIAHLCHVPSSYLYRSLHIKDKRELHDTLQMIAIHEQRPVNVIIKEIQTSVLIYRRQHSHPKPLHPNPTRTLVSVVGRVEY